jgi:hypothetical protein
MRPASSPPLIRDRKIESVNSRSGEGFQQTARSSFQCSAGMSARADIYRQRAAEAKQSAAKAKNPAAKTAFEEVARGWLYLAEQMEWMDRQEASTPQGKTNDTRR